jgi:hypothetical protein
MNPPDELTDLLARAHATHATDPCESVQCGRAALALADSGGDIGLRIRARRTLAAALSRRDEGREADALLQEALVLLVEAPDEVERGRVLSWLAALDARAGQLDSATRAILTARQLLAGSEDAEAIAAAEWLYGVILVLGGDLAGALERTEAARAIALVHARQLLPMILSNLAAVHGELGDPRRAVESLQFAARLLDSSRDGKTRSNVHTNLCVAYARLGEFEAAMRHGELAVAHGREVGSGPSEAEALQNMAELSEQMGDVPGALERIQEALDRLPSSRWQATEVGCAPGAAHSCRCPERRATRSKSSCVPSTSPSRSDCAPRSIRSTKHSPARTNRRETWAARFITTSDTFTRGPRCGATNSNSGCGPR